MDDDNQKQTALKLRIDQSWRPVTEMELYRLPGGSDRDLWLLDILESAGYEDAGTAPGKPGNPVPVPNSVIEQIEALLGKVDVTLQPNVMMGCDGVDYHLALTGFGVTAKFYWWEEPPTEWKPLEAIVDLLIEQAGPVCRQYRAQHK